MQFPPPSSAALDRSLGASCKDSIGWMFSKLDTNGDLYLGQSELTAINLDKYEVCIRPFFNSCDSYKDGKISMAEWCLCFWRESECVLCAVCACVSGGAQPRSEPDKEVLPECVSIAVKKYIYIIFMILNIHWIQPQSERVGLQL